MNRIELIEKMYKIMDEKLVAYRKDFLYDIDTLYTVDSNIWYWFIRDTGTHLTFNEELIETYKTYNDEGYIITLENGIYFIEKFWEKL